MRIIGGRDYYDGAAAYGVDTTQVFVRDSRHLTNQQMRDLGLPSDLSLTISEKGEGKNLASVSTGKSYFRREPLHGEYYEPISHAVYFCGKLYKGLEVKTNSQSYFFWHWDKLVKWAEDRDLEVHRYLYSWQKADKCDPFEPMELSEATIQQMISLKAAIIFKKGYGSGEPYYKTKAEWLEKDSGWVADTDGLKDIGFQSAIDPVTAFQELSMWVGGTLSASNGPNTIEIQDDKVKLAKHGMNEWSFRKHKDDV